MSHRSLADFLEELEHAGELLRVDAEIQPVIDLEKAREKGDSPQLPGARTGTIPFFQESDPAVLFTAVQGHDMPLAANLLGTEARICLALGVASLDEVKERIAALVQPAEPEGWLDRLKTAPHASALSSVLPRRVKSGACQQVVRLGRDVDLTALPLVRSFSGGLSQFSSDENGTVPLSGPSITAAVLIAAEPDAHRQIAGRYDLQMLSADRLAVCWAAHDEPARLLAEFRRRNQQMPLAAALGGDPSLLVAAAAPLPPMADACALAGLLRQKPLDVLPCRGVDLQVPAEAEIVIEGYIDPKEPPQSLGLRYTSSGCYSQPCTAPIMHVTAVTHRANPVFPAIIHQPPPNEACAIQRAVARIFLPVVKLAIPELVDYDLPAFAAARHWASLSISKTYPGQAWRVANAAWGLRQLMFAKVLVIVDEDVDVHDPQQVLAAVAMNMNPGHDVLLQAGPPDPFDPTHVPGALGQRMAIDATRQQVGWGLGSEIRG
jgi:4-hydroxy-3-polyprenylbenzoate decarboxylase